MDKITFLWKGASYQDHLLQSYRSFYLTVASISLLIGAALMIAVHTFADSYTSFVMYAMFTVISVFALYFSVVMKRLIAARAADVDYYHNRILEYEKSLPEEQQVLTSFKVHQKFGRKGHTDLEVTDEIRSQLVEKGRGHTRKVLDKHVSAGFYIIWCCFHIACIVRLFTA